MLDMHVIMLALGLCVC